MRPRDSSLLVRPIVGADIKRVVELHHACLPHELWRREDVCAFAAKSRPHGNVFKVIVDEDDKLYGTLLLSLDNGVCRIRRVAVWPDYRRRSVATFAIKTLTGPLSLFRSQRFFVVNLTNCKDKDGVRAFFAKLGFEPGVQPAEYVRKAAAQLQTPKVKSLF